MRITDALLGEHAVFYAEFAQCESILKDCDLPTVKQLAALLGSALDTHAEIEDRLLFGPLASYTTADPGIFQLMEEEHHTIAELLRQIARARSSEKAAELLSEMIAAARAHFEKEEEVAFPRAEQLLGAEELRKLGKRWSEERGVAVNMAV